MMFLLILLFLVGMVAVAYGLRREDYYPFWAGLLLIFAALVLQALFP